MIVLAMYINSGQKPAELLSAKTSILRLCNTGHRRSHKFCVSSFRLRVLNDDDDLCSGMRNGKLALYSHYPQYLFFSSPFK